MFNVKNRVLKIVFLFTVVGILLLVVYTKIFKSLSVDLITVPHRYITSVFEAFNEITLYFKEKKSLIDENINLKKQIEILKLENRKIFYLEKENDALKKAVELKNHYTFNKVVLAKVVAFSPDNWVNGFFIDVGSKNGIKEGDLVIAGGYLIGIVKSVGFVSSEVMSVNDKNFKITVRTRKTGEVCFYNGLDYKKGVLKYVRPEQDVRFSDVVETTVLNSGNPEGIPVGIIRSISTKEGEFFREVQVETFYYPYNLNYVLVVVR